MMMPFELSSIQTLPPALHHYKQTVQQLINFSSVQRGIAYLTIDEKFVRAGSTHRRAGLHVDGVFHNGCGGWGGGSGGWGATGFITVASERGCRVYPGTFVGAPGPDGECEHLAEQCTHGVDLEPSTAYWLDPLCVHESLRMEADTRRIFVRLSMPSDAPWFEGYTVNSLGVQPTGPILPRRIYMND